VPVSFAKFSPNGRFILVSTLDGRLRLWDYMPTTSPTNHHHHQSRSRSGYPRVVKTYSGHVNSAFCIFSSFTLHGATPCVVSGSEDGSVMLWDVQTEATLQILRRHTDAVLAIASHPKKPILASGALDKTIYIWHPLSRHRLA
jgi:COMPASS component SWD3